MIFTTIAARAGEMMSHANLNQESHLLSCKEAIETATILDNLTVIKLNLELKTSYEHSGKVIPSSASSFKHVLK